MKKILNYIGSLAVMASAWLLLSSKDPAKVSLTLRAGLVAAVSVIIQVSGILQIPIGESDLMVAVDALVAFVNGALTLIALGVTAYAAIRKIWTTIRGNNRVIEIFGR